VCREILEEIGYRMPPDRFEPMASFSGVDPAGDGGRRVLRCP
jgi:hypothetical protein